MTDGWRTLDFDSAVADVSGGNVKTPQGEYKRSGQFAVVDQGKALVAGYVDDIAQVCKAPLPVVVFGDHTRCLKFIDFPFGVGADGVKVLRPMTAELDTKYLYHFLRQLRLPDGGYDRHFKYLKREKIPFPPLAEQRRIAAILDQAETLRAQRRAAIAQLDSLGQAIFLEMFGDPIALGGATVADFVKGFESGKSLAADDEDDTTSRYRVLKVSAVTSLTYRPGESKALPPNYVPPPSHFVRPGDLLFSRANTSDLIGATAFVDSTPPDLLLPDKLWRFVWHDEPRALPHYVAYLFRQPKFRAEIARRASGTSGSMKNISQEKVLSIKVALPAIAAQEVFARRIQAIEALKSTQRSALARLDELFASLQHRAFRGELTARAVRQLEPTVGLEALIFIAKRMPAERYQHYKALKALYFADKHHLEKHGRLIYGETHCALPHGPVPQAAYDATRVLNGERLLSDFDDEALRAGLRRIKDDQQDKLVALRDADFSKLGAAERESLEWAVRYCAGMSFEQVKAASHDTAYGRTLPNQPIPLAYLIDMLPADAQGRQRTP